jgi:hypothetical protein
MARSALAVLAGFAAATVGVLVASALVVRVMFGGFGPDVIPTPGYLGVNLGYSLLFAVCGGYVAATVARRRPVAHAAGVGVIMLILGVASIVLVGTSGMGEQPAWYPYILLVLGPAGALLGGVVKGRASRA